MGVFAALAGLFSGIFNYFGTQSTNRTNSLNVSRTNQANLEQTMLTNQSNEKIANEVNALNYKMFGEGNAFSAEEAEKARQFNALEAEKSRRYNGAVEQVARSLAAGLSPMDYNATGVSPAASAAQGSPLSGLGATTGAPAQAAQMQAHQNQVPHLDLGGVESSLLGFSNLLETKRKNDADIVRDMRNAGSQEVQAAASKEQAQASSQNAKTSEKMLGVAQQNADSQSRVASSQAELYDVEAALRNLEITAFPQRLAAELQVSEATAQQLTQLAASYSSQLQFLYHQLQVNDALARDLQDNQLSQDNQHFLDNIRLGYDNLKANIMNNIGQLNLGRVKIHQTQQMFDKEFETTHGGIINHYLDRVGLPRIFHGAIGFTPIK